MLKSPEYDRWRPDHVLCKLPVSLEGASIEKIGEFTIPPFEKEGVKKIEEDGIVRSPSDHFGLYAVIPLRNK